MKNAEYWRARFAILEEAAHKQSDQYLQSLEELYLEAQLSVQKEIEAWYGRFAVNNQISLSDARKLLTTGQLEEFKWTVDQYVKAAQKQNLSPEWVKKLENASARFHVSRLEAVQMQIQQQIELLYGNQVDGIDNLMRQLISNGYTQGAFEIQKGIGLGWDITALNQKKLDTLLSKPWTTDSRTFRDRCWTNKAELVDTVNKELIQGMLRGDSPEKAITAIQKKFGTSRYKARRLVHTETSYFNATSKLQMYRDLGVEQIEIVETLDSRTCAVCGELDGKVIPLSQYEPGVTVPPWHPNCRGTTCPHYDDMDGERAARDAEGKVYYIPANMTFTQWKKAFVDGVKDGLTSAAVGSTIKTAGKKKSENFGVQTVGHIDIEKYRCITDDITTDEVIITDERIQHIKERHPGDYERYIKYIAEILKDPDYILAANKPNTGVILKKIKENGEKFKVILRVKVENDPAEYRNSILSFWHIGETTWNKNVKNKRVLYKWE